MIRAILFDLDDTLYDEMEFVKGGFKAVSSYISRNNKVNQNAVYKLLLDVLERHGRGYTFDIVLKKLDLYSRELILKLVEIYRMHKPNLSLYPGIKAVLSILRNQGYKVGLITDGNVGVQKSKVEALRVKDVMDCMVFSDKYGIEKRKPSSFPYRKALDVLGVRPQESMYLGDNPNKDFVTAKKMGMYTVRIKKDMYANLNINPSHEAHYQIDSLSDAIDIIGRIDSNEE